ncbi:hypothetical protein [Paenibacillus oceani]|uniref:Uncharacterized protein n=1 Tax=Paenibacillus oceani TaxID=2772510 RepID=A0A927CAT1_9BACL|nr:hypothetical protein [Paenibacillus oceani]MBD2863167.1 hypothetical protein [Paenibacillus oceani]
MRSNKLLLLVIVELIIAIAFAVTSILVFLYQKDDLWMQTVLVLGGIAGVWNGYYLIKQRQNQVTRRRGPAKPSPKSKR